MVNGYNVNKLDKYVVLTLWETDIEGIENPVSLYLTKESTEDLIKQLQNKLVEIDNNEI